MKRPFQLVPLLFVLAILAPLEFAQSPAYDSAPQRRLSGRPNSFMEFTLGRLNPQNMDYGRCLSESRRVLLEETINNGLFWSNVVALGLLGCFFTIVIYQRGLLTRRELSTADLLAQHEHALAGCQTQLRTALVRNRELAEMITAVGEPAAQANPRAVQSVDQAVPSSVRSLSSNAKSMASTATNPAHAKPDISHTATTTMPVQPVDQMRLFSPDADLIIKVNSLEQQLAHSQRDNHALRRRLANGSWRQATEKPRNQAKEA